MVAGLDCHGPNQGSIPVSYHVLVQSSTRLFFGMRILDEDEGVSRQSTRPKEKKSQKVSEGECSVDTDV